MKSEVLERCCERIAWGDLDMDPIRALIELTKGEDLQGTGLRTKPSSLGDHSANLLPESQRFSASIRAREPIVLCGIELVQEVAATYDSELKITPSTKDGDSLDAERSIGVIEGPVRSALSAERPILNFLQKLSGIATETRRYVDTLEGSTTKLLDTRKTTPGFRYLEKYAVACGGGWNHRMGLFDRVMLKDNHLAAFGSDLVSATKAAVAECRTRNPHLMIEMEVDRLGQIPAALEAGIDIILLDNFSIEDLQKARELIGDQAVTEISGGVTLDSLPSLRDLGHDFISTGALVHQSTWVDIGLDAE